MIAVKGDLTEAEMDRIKGYIVNPVESRLASMEKPESLDMKIDYPADVKRVTGMIAWSEEELKAYYGTMGFAMTLEDLAFCRDYFRDEEHARPDGHGAARDRYLLERPLPPHHVFDPPQQHRDRKGQAERCDRKGAWRVFRGARGAVCRQKQAGFADGYGDDRHEIPQKAREWSDNLDESDEINACSIEVPVEIDGKTEQWLVQFKNETHNHPTEIEPFGGAATCLGGAIRDPLSGRAYVYQAMRVTGSGDPDGAVSGYARGKAALEKDHDGAAAGYSSYGNQIGLATGQVTELYDPGYVAKRMEIGAVIGASRRRTSCAWSRSPAT